MFDRKLIPNYQNTPELNQFKARVAKIYGKNDITDLQFESLLRCNHATKQAYGCVSTRFFLDRLLDREQSIALPTGSIYDWFEEWEGHNTVAGL